PRADGPENRVEARGNRGSELDLGADFHDVIGWNSEELRRRLRISREKREEEGAPARHAGPLRGDHRLPTQKEGDPLEARIDEAALDEQLRDVRLLHEAVARRDPDEALGQGLDAGALTVRDARGLIREDREKHDVLVDDAVVEKVVEEGGRRALERARHEDRGAGHACGTLDAQQIEEVFE